MSDQDSKAPIYIAIIVAAILIAAGAYYVLEGSSAKKNIDKKTISSTNKKSYYFVSHSQSGITNQGGVSIVLDSETLSPRESFIALEKGLKELRSQCHVVMPYIPFILDGFTIGYSVTVEGSCNINQ